MLKRNIALILSVMLLAASFGFQSAQAQTGSETDLTTKARARVKKLGVGRNARVEVKLRDKTGLKGYISTTAQDSFTVTAKTGSPRTVAYADVSEVKKPGSGLSTKSRIIIGSAVVGAIVTWIVLKPVLCDGGAQSRGPC